MESGLRGPYDDAFYQRRSRIGRRHVQIGLAQHYMLTAMNVLRNDYIEALAVYGGADAAGAGLSEQIKSVNRLFDIELAIMLRHYQVHSEEQLLAQERRRQNEKVAAMQALTAGLAHEVRNPLNSAKLQLSLLQRRLAKLGVDRSLQEPAKLVHDEIDRLTALLNDFLAFARPPRLDTQEQDLRVLLGHVVELERPGALARQVELVIVPCATPMLARIDGPKLHQVVFNLVRNALEAVNPGGRVELALRASSKHVIIEVKDNGHGITPEVLQRIYEPFFSTKPEGTGIGMAIVQNLVQLHGGTLEVETSPRGTVFKVLLPAVVAKS